MFSRFATWSSIQLGRGMTFVVVLILVAVWILVGFRVGFANDAYQFAMNSPVSILTLIAAILVQHTQNRDTAALHAKLDEIIRVTDARNELRGIERLPDPEMKRLLDEAEAESDLSP